MKKFSVKRGIAAAMMALCLIGGATGAMASAKTVKYSNDSKVQYDYTWNGGQYARYYYRGYCKNWCGKTIVNEYSPHWVSITNTSHGGYDRKSTISPGWTPKATISANTWGTYRFNVNFGTGL